MGEKSVCFIVGKKIISTNFLTYVIPRVDILCFLLEYIFLFLSFCLLFNFLSYFSLCLLSIFL